MSITPVREDIAQRLSERVRAAHAAGNLIDTDAMFPEVAGEGTQLATIEGATQQVMAVMGLAAAGLVSGPALRRSIHSALVLASATGYAVGVELYDERARELAGDMFPPASE